MAVQPLNTHADWYKDAIIYELHVRAFADSNSDGIGDFAGLTAKLDYLQSLGVTALWLLPFYPSPLKDDGYDIADYTSIHPDYGTMRDFKHFLEEAHRRDLRVICELVLNHTSDQHPWFQRARQAKPDSHWRKFYVWNDTPEKYEDARVIFQDFESSNWSWDGEAQAYFWHRFYSHQPDLNYDNPQVRKAILKVVDFWLDLGVDGLRLDAVPYLFEREGTSGENLPKTHAALRRLRSYIDNHYPNRMLLAEANQWPEQAVAYFGEGDECHMAFHFPLMPRLFMGLRMEDRFPIVDILDQTPPIPDNAQWALFLRNHDELTLEMVTEEERYYMYRSYAQNAEARINLGIRHRLAPLLGNDRRRLELLNGLLCSLPGTPVLYYGDEIGMGDNVYLGDRSGVRTPMQWSADRNAGFSQANPQQLYLPLITDHEYRHETVNVEAQEANPHSLLSWMKWLIKLRRGHQAFGRGSLRMLEPDNRKALAFIREYEGERILVVANLSRFLQHVQLDLSDYEGYVPTEVFGRTPFPAIGELPYMLTLAPHAFYWFSIGAAAVETVATVDVPQLVIDCPWDGAMSSENRALIEAALPRYIQNAIWFGSKTRPILESIIFDHATIIGGESPVHLALVQVSLADGEPQRYLVPLAFATNKDAERVRKQAPEAVIAELSCGEDRSEGVLYDALWSPELAHTLLEGLRNHRRFRAEFGSVTGTSGPAFRELRQAKAASLKTATVQAEHNNTSVVFANRWIMKLFRCLDEGVNPEIELGAWLTERGFTHTPPVIGSLEYHPQRGQPISLAVVQEFVPNQGEAWDWVQDELAQFFATAHTLPGETTSSPGVLLELSREEAPEQVQKLPGDVLPRMRLLGQRTAEMHMALALDTKAADFRPEPFTEMYQRSLYQSMRGLVGRVSLQLGQSRTTLPESLLDDANAIMALVPDMLAQFRQLADQRIGAVRSRCHGDFHLEQVLVTEDDLVIFDFEGEAKRPIIERRLKQSPLRDVATMLRSLQYATYVARLDAAGQHKGSDEAAQWESVLKQEAAACFWYRWAGAAFLGGYFATITGSGLLPTAEAECTLLLDSFMLEKAVSELRYELDNRPERIRIALLGIRQTLEDAR